MTHNVAFHRLDGKILIEGELSFKSVSQLASEPIVDGAQCLVIDLSKVTHSDSAGLALLINWYREASQKTVKISFEGVPDKMAALAKVSNLDKILPIV